MSNFRLLFSLLILLFCFISTKETAATDNKSPQSQPQPFDVENDYQQISSHLDRIQVPAYVSTFDTNSHGNKRLTATDHSIVSAISTSAQLCKKIGGEKGAATCSYLLIDRPWRHWPKKLSQSFHSTKTRYAPIIYNFIVKTLNYAYIDGLHALQNKVHDWWKFPSLEWHLLKSSLVSLWDQYYYDYLNWYSGKKRAFHELNQRFYSNEDKNDKNDRLDYYNNRHEISGKNDGNELEPDVNGCYYDVLGTTLCVDEQRLLDDNGLKDRVNELFEAMTYDERSHTLRFQQRFIQWATKASSMTAEAMDRAQSLWLQHIQAAYRFLDDALYLNPHTNNNNNGSNSSKQDDGRTTQTTNQMNLCPPVIFPFSISPFDTSLETTFFSLGGQPQSLQSAPPPAQSYLPLIPIRRSWTACLPSKNDSPDDESSSEDHDFDIPEKKSIHSSRHSLDPYNKIQYQYLLTRLQKEMMKQLERLEKATLQEYHRAMNTAPHQWTLHHYDRQQLQQHRRQLQSLHIIKPGYAAQQLYQELRLYISISLKQLYQKSIQQLMDVTKQYDALAMKHVEHAYDEWEWTKKQQARRLFTFYPHHDDTTNMNHQVKELLNSPPSPVSASSYTADTDSAFSSSSSSPSSDNDAKHGSQQNQEQQQSQEHGGQVDVDYDAQCQQWWKKKKSWRFVNLLSSMAEQLGYYHYNKHKNNDMDDDNYTLLSTMTSSNTPTTSSSGHHTPKPATSIINTRAVMFIGQRADRAVQVHRQTVLHQWKTIFQDMDRQSRSIWVSAMDQAQGRHRIWANYNVTCTFAIILAKLTLLVLFLLYA